MLTFSGDSDAYGLIEEQNDLLKELNSNILKLNSNICRLLSSLMPIEETPHFSL